MYEEALAIELSGRSIAVQRQHPVSVPYKGKAVDEGTDRPDLSTISLMVELKAVETLLPVHKAQLISYLKASRLRLRAAGQFQRVCAALTGFNGRLFDVSFLGVLGALAVQENSYEHQSRRLPRTARPARPARARHARGEFCTRRRA
ncbi:MAG: GxxExxY protein [Chromatiales bacterium]|nr:GxxExxY protein [Chromatiales bacterium]